jgi:hypothetical protein
LLFSIAQIYYFIDLPILSVIEQELYCKTGF